jgi:hypothetical protein
VMADAIGFGRMTVPFGTGSRSCCAVTAASPPAVSNAQNGEFKDVKQKARRRIHSLYTTNS